MTSKRLNIISEALYSCSASDFNVHLLNSISLEELLSLSKSIEEPRAAFRAAWALEHILIADKSLLLANNKELIKLYIDSSNWSVLRSITKLIMDLNKEQGLTSLHTAEKEQLVEKTFLILADTNCPIAVRCNAYDILFGLAAKEEWLLHELKIQIQFDLDKNSTPALKSRGLRILKKLSRLELKNTKP